MTGAAVAASEGFHVEGGARHQVRDFLPRAKHAGRERSCGGRRGRTGGWRDDFFGTAGDRAGLPGLRAGAVCTLGAGHGNDADRWAWQVVKTRHGHVRPHWRSQCKLRLHTSALRHAPAQNAKRARHVPATPFAFGA